MPLKRAIAFCSEFKTILRLSLVLILLSSLHHFTTSFE
jgi:hypothetical protein